MNTINVVFIPNISRKLNFGSVIFSRVTMPSKVFVKTNFGSTIQKTIKFSERVS